MLTPSATTYYSLKGYIVLVLWYIPLREKIAPTGLQIEISKNLQHINRVCTDNIDFNQLHKEAWHHCSMIVTINPLSLPNS